MSDKRTDMETALNGVPRRNPRVYSGSISINIPIEFLHLPTLQPPDMSDPHNINGEWYCMNEWRTPAVKSASGQLVQVVVRSPKFWPDGFIRGFSTDGMSIPLIAQPLMQQTPLSLPALYPSLGHDMAYSAELADRSTCDNWFFDWAEMGGVTWVQRELDYAALAAAGWTVWEQHTPESIAEAQLFVQLVDNGAPAVWPEIN